MILDKEKSNSIEKALKILSVFTPFNEEMGTVEISHKLGYHKATVSRIIQTLLSHGYLRQNKQTKKYFIGPTVMELAHAASRSFKTNIVKIAKPYIDNLRDKYQDTAILEVLSGDSAFMAYIAEGPRLIRLAGNIGDRVPIHASAGSKTILAFLPPEQKRQLLTKKLRRFTDNTITDRNLLDQQLEEIAQDGVGYDNEEIDEGTCAIGAPIFNHVGNPIGAVVIAGPSQRIDLSKGSAMAAFVKETAERISAELLYCAPTSSDLEEVNGLINRTNHRPSNSKTKKEARSKK